MIVFYGLISKVSETI